MGGTPDVGRPSIAGRISVAAGVRVLDALGILGVAEVNALFSRSDNGRRPSTTGAPARPDAFRTGLTN